MTASVRTVRWRSLAVGARWFLAMLFLVAVLAPFLANRYPLTVARAGERSWPAFASLTGQDVAWLGALALAIWWRVTRGRLRGAGLAVLVTTVIFVALSRESVNLSVIGYTEMEKQGARVVWAPVPFDPEQVHVDSMGASPGGRHVLGSDRLGKDVAARVIHGARISLLVGLVAVGLSSIVGVLLGGLAGYYGGFPDAVISWLVQVFMCFPVLVLVLALAAFVKPSILWIMVVLGLVRWTGPARLFRAEVMRLRRAPFVDAARVQGAGNGHILWRHILPNALSPLVVNATFGVSGAILLESTLSFLGLGSDRAASWGSLLREGADAMPRLPHLALVPGLLLFLTLLSFNVLGEHYRDAHDPRMGEA